MKKVLNELENWNGKLPKATKGQKFKKMSNSEYIFFRGTNHLFWNFLSEKKYFEEFDNEEAITWIIGDLHAFNFGTYLNDNGTLIYNINDFDESVQHLFFYDIIRMAVSIILVAKENKFNDTQIDEFVQKYIESYFDTLKNYTQTGKLSNEITVINAFGKLDEHMGHILENKSRKKQLDDYTLIKQDNYSFDLSHSKLDPISEDEKHEILNAFEKYSSNLYEKHHFPENYFKVLDIAQRITSGTGSYGLKRYFVLIQGDEEKWKQRILDVKMQEFSTPCRFIPKPEYNKYLNNGERYVKACKALSIHTDNHLGYILLNNKSFSIHERSPFKSYFPTQILNTPTRFNKLTQQWATITATVHLRAGTLFNPDKIITNKEFPQLKKMILNTAFEYEKLNASVYKKFIDKFLIDE